MPVILVKQPFFIGYDYFAMGSRHEIDKKDINHPFIKERAVILTENKPSKGKQVTSTPENSNPDDFNKDNLDKVREGKGVKNGQSKNDNL